MVTIQILPSGKILSAAEGAKLRDVLQEAGILLDYPCGGKGSCRQCKVTVEPAADSGKGKLPESEISKGVRLACQMTLEADCSVTIPDERMSKKLWKQGIRDEDITAVIGAPSVRRLEVSLGEPSIEDQRPDWERLERELVRHGMKPGCPDPGALEELSRILRHNGWAADAVVEGDEFLWVPAVKGERVYGFAVDLGTTTVDIALLDLESGKRLARKAFLNRQVSFGADVITRAQSFHADRGPIRAAVLDTIEEGAQMILEEMGVRPSQVVKTVIVGNPIMIHILNGMDPFQLTLYPFIPLISCAIRSRPRDFGWRFQGYGYVITLPLISAYVGADTVAMIISLDLEHEDRTSLSIDIGTNGEMVLARKGRMVCTSTAAGPAFEGAQISCGMRALEGAVYGMAIEEDGTLDALVIGGARPKGICGTGLVAGIARMLEQGIIDPTGRLVDPEELDSLKLRERIFNQNGEQAFSLSDDGSVYISQGDIRKLQLAKGAVRTGIETLLETSGVTKADLDVLRLAGNFGAGLEAASAMRIGLIPEMDLRKVEVIGNAALRGAVLALLSREHSAKADSAAKNSSFIELGSKPEFQARFAESMMF
jgi:uncharacterized 2Fe-2S/4Fe-4S cluster protein (DUF4445 family)